MSRMRCAVVAVTAAVTVGFILTVANGATREGAAVVVDAADTRKSVSAGDHDTAFTLRLPTGATCPGDSMNDDWRVQTFVIPATDDPGMLTYTVAVTGPDGPKDDARVALYSTEGRPYVHQMLGANAEPGHPGEIPMLPAFSFKRLPIDYLPTGEYLMGVACTDYASATQTYWATSIHINSSPTAMTWTVTAEQPASSGGSGSTFAVVLLVVLGAGLLGVAVVLWRRSSRRHGAQAQGETAIDETGQRP